MQEIDKTLPDTPDYTITCGVGECFHCGIVKFISECKICKNTVCNKCRSDHKWTEHH